MQPMAKCPIRFIAHPLRIEDGDAVAPDRPGYGVEFDWQALAELEMENSAFFLWILDNG